MLYTVLLVAICLMLALLLHRSARPQEKSDDEALKAWLQQQLDAQAKSFAQQQEALARSNEAAIRTVSEALQTAVQNMSTTLAQGQSGQQNSLTQRLQSLEAANTQKLEELRRTLAESMAALQAENTRKLDEIRRTVDEQLQDAQASGDAAAVENARHALELVLRSEAKDIREKYVEPPYTTAFGILFLPFEGLYAEVVNAGLLEVLQRDYQVNVAGPSTMAALLNSLQMGFKTLAIQKRSGEVWQLLGAVKTEFEKFGQGLTKMQQRLRQTDEELDNLIGVRSRAISRKLRSVQSLDDASAATLLELDADPGRPVAARLPEGGED